MPELQRNRGKMGAGRQVSVIVNNFNKAPYLKQCLESIAAQTHRPIEVIFWDDCSADDSVEVFQSWQASCRESEELLCSRFFSTAAAVREAMPMWKPSPPAGTLPLGVTRWMALHRCTGDYVALCDSDDWWEAEKLASQLERFSPGVGVVFSDCHYYNEKTRQTDGTFHHRYPVPRQAPSGNWRDFLLTRYNCMPASTLVFDRRKLVDTVGPPTHYTSGEDYDWLLKITEHYNAAYEARPLSYYRLLPDSVTHEPRKSTRATWYEIDAAISSYRRKKPMSRIRFLKHLVWLYGKLAWKQFYREKF